MSGDWRLTNQASYLTGAALVHKPYKAYREGWDHDHCEFCWVKFMDADDLESQPKQEDVRTVGYTTTEDHRNGADYHWICADCFADFAQAFGWRV